MYFKTPVAALALLVTPAAALQLQPTRNDVQAAVTSQSYTSVAESDERQWRTDARAALARLTPDAAADMLATKYGFTPANMRRLLRVWIIAKSHQFGLDHSWVQNVRAEIFALVPGVKGKAVGLAILAEALDATTEDCTANDFKALMAGSPNPADDAYVIATNAACTGNFARAAVAAGPRALPALIRAAGWGGLPPRDVLPLYAWLASPAALDHVREGDRQAVAALLWQRYLTALFAAGMDARALALFDGLPAELRTEIVSPRSRPRLVAVIDGITMTFAAEDDTADDYMTATLANEADALADQADALADRADAKAPATAGAPAAPS